MVIAIASDHAGYELRRQITEHLRENGHTVLEGGARSSEDATSYVGPGREVSSRVLSGEAHRGIALCGTGIGISVICNKHRGIRCALCTDEFMARMSREHNDANVLAMGARVLGQGLALSIADAFLETEFESGGRHQTRVAEISELEERNFQDDYPARQRGTVSLDAET